MTALWLIGTMAITGLAATVSQRILNRRRNLDIVDPNFTRLRQRHRKP